MRRATLRLLASCIAVTFAVAAAAHGCELPAIERGCGNHVVEAGEACDGDALVAPGLDCGEPGTEFACQYVCDGASQYGRNACCPEGQPCCCPQGMSCGLDGRCRKHTSTFVPASAPLDRGADQLQVGDLDGDRRLDVIRVTDDELTVAFGAVRDGLPVLRQQVYEAYFLPAVPERAVGDDASSECGGGSLGPDAAPADGAARQRSDLFVPRFGMVSLRADDGQQLQPASLPTLYLPPELGDLAVLPLGNPTDLHVAWLTFHVSVESLSALVMIIGAEFRFLTLTRGRPSDLSAPAVIAQFDERPQSPCEDIVLGYTDKLELEFFNPCKQQGTAWVPNACSTPLTCPEDMPRVLTVERPVRRGPFAVDLNDDGHLDLVVQVSAPEQTDCGYEECFATHAAYGVGNGTFHSDLATLPTTPDSGDNQLAPLAGLVADGAPILALGSLRQQALDGKTYTDAITPRDIRLYRNDYQREDVTALNSGEPWTEALIGDFNGNGLSDTLAIREGGTTAVFYNGTGKGALTPFSVLTEAPLTQLRIGDFDGDLLQDAMAVRGSVDDGCREIVVLFGAPSGAPDPPVVLGQTDHVLTLFAGKMAGDLAVTLEGISDGATDAMAVGWIDGKPTAIHGFGGRSDREIRSPLGLMELAAVDPLNAAFSPQLSRRLIAGHFAADENGGALPAEQLAVVTVEVLKPESDYRLWFVPALNPEFHPEDAVQASQPLQSQQSELPAAIWERGMFAAIDADGNGIDELLVVAPRSHEASRSVYRFGSWDGADWKWSPQTDVSPLELPLSRYETPTLPCRDPFGFPDEPACESTDFSSVASTALDVPASNGRMLACDLEGDRTGEPPIGSAEQLVVLSRDAGLGEPAVPAKLLVYRFAGALELDADRFWRVDLALPTDTPVYDFACLDADGDRGQEMVVLTGEGARLVNPSAPGGWGDPSQLPDWNVVRLEGLEGYFRIVAGDFDGDGLDDLVVGNPDEVRLFYGAASDRGEVAP